MRIGELAEATGVSRRLLRYYEEQGLLKPTRLANGYREYSETDVATVRHVRALLAAGLPTSSIARLVTCFHDDSDRVVPTSCPPLIASLRRQRQRITAEITQLRSSQQALDTLLTTALQDAAERS